MGPRRLSAAFAATLLGLATSCAGPRVRVGPAEVRAGEVGHVLVETTFENAGGAGELKATARVRDRKTGRTFMAARSVGIGEKERLGVVVDVPAPPGDYVATVTVAFPPD